MAKVTGGKNATNKIMNKLNVLKSSEVLHEVSIAIEDMLSELIETEVYEAYEPLVYDRRHNERGGFGDESSLKTDIDRHENGAILTTTNEALAVGLEKGDRLDYIIEYGIYSTFKDTDPPPPRPVFAKAKRVIKQSKGKIITILKDELNK